MAQIDNVTRHAMGDVRPRVMRCGCKYLDNPSTGIAEHMFACDDHLARLRRRTVSILVNRRNAIAAGARSSAARLYAWTFTSDHDRAGLRLAAWTDAYDEKLDVIAYRTVEQMLEHDAALLLRADIDFDVIDAVTPMDDA